jgi:phage-related tail fiber protein
MPTLDTDAANKGYVDAAVNGTDWKQSARVGTTANLAALSGLLTIDTITLVANDRVLVKDQTTQSANGIYLAGSGAWVRATDADANAEVTAGMALMVTEGAVNGDTQWRLMTNDAIVVGTTALVFAQIGAGTSYTPGAGISIAGNVVSIDTAVATRKFAATVGDAVAVSISVTHSLATLDVQVQVYEVATGATVECDVVRNTTNQVTLGFTTAPAASALRVTVQG